MLTHITRHIAIIAVFMHSLLCGNAYCCAMTCSGRENVASVSHDSPLPVSTSTCPCHSEKHEPETGQENPTGHTDSKHDCDHQHHFCQCLHSAVPNNGTGFRVVLNLDLFALPVAFLSATDTLPLSALDHRTSKTADVSSTLGVRLHLLLEHFLI